MDVRFRVRDWEYEIDTGWSASVGSIRPGEQHWTSVPFELPGGVGERELGLSHDRSGEEPNSVLWYIETQFSDIRGAYWLAQPDGFLSMSYRPRRLRSSRLDFWRERPELDRVGRPLNLG